MTYPRSSPGYSFGVLGSRQVNLPYSPVGGFFCQPVEYPGGQIGVPSAMGSVPRPYYVSPSLLPASSVFPGSFCFGQGGVGHGQERGDRGGITPLSGLLWPSFYSSQELGGSQASPRPLTSKQVPSSNPFSDGDAPVHPKFDQAGGLGNLPGPEGRLLSCSNASQFKKISSFRVEQQSVSIQGPSFRPLASSLGVHQSHKGASYSCQGQRHSPQNVFGRLANAGILPSSGSDTHRGASGPNCDPGVSPKLGEIGAGPLSAVRLPRHGLRYSHLYCSSGSSEAIEVQNAKRQSSDGPVGFCKTAILSPRSNGVSGPACSSGPRPQAEVSEAIPQTVAPVSPILGVSTSPRRLVQSFSGPVVGRRVASARRPHSSTPLRGGALHRCVERRLGCPRCASRSLGQMARFYDRPPHQCSGTRGSLLGSEEVRVVPQEQAHSNMYRQHHCCMLHKQGGWRSLHNSLQEGRESIEVVPFFSDLYLSQVRSRENERGGRCSESLKSSHSDGMDSDSLSLRTSMEDVAQANGGFVCHKVQSQASSVLLSGTRPSGPRSRCSEPQLEGSDRLRFSPSRSSEQSHSESQDRASVPHSGHSLLALPALVSRPSRVDPLPSSQTGSSFRRPGSTPLRDTARKSRVPQPSRLASVRSKLQSLGASTHLVHLVEKARRRGTCSVYDSHWRRWLSWCEDNEVDFSSPSSIEFGNFLSYLFERLGKSVSTVRVHRSAISSTIRQLGGPSFSDDPLIRDTLRGASHSALRTPRRLPAWDLFLVLDSLRHPPYEPLSSANLKDLTFKTVFLVTLASGRRASEINGLSGLPTDISKEPDGSYSLRFLPEFVAKNQSAQAPSPVVNILPLVPFCSDEEDSKLCPVRSLRRYLHFSKSLRDGKRKLFISHNPSYRKDIIASTLSGWLRKVIAKAYKDQDGNTSLEPRDIRKAHEIRAWASSLAFHDSWSLQDVMQAAYWKTESPFINYYLRDVRAVRQDGTYGFASVVAAGRNVHLH